MYKEKHENYVNRVEIYRVEMEYYASVILQDRVVAQDVVQDIFANIVESSLDIKKIVNVRRYLMRAVKNRYLNLLRGQVRSQRKLDKYSEMFDVESVDDESQGGEERVQLIMNSIDQLPEKCREIFRLCGIERRSYEEVAEKLGISVNTVKTQMARASKHLKEVIIKG